MVYTTQVGIEVVEPEAAMGRHEGLVEAAQARALAAGVPEAFLERCHGWTGVVTDQVTGWPGP